MKIETTTQLVLAPLNNMAQDGSGLEYEVIRDVSTVRYNARGIPSMSSAQDRTPCINLSHGVSEWWTAINRCQRLNPNTRVIDISPDYSVTLFHTSEG